MQTTQTQPLFSRIGGMPAVEAAVAIFYGKVMQDPRINHFFKHIDMEKQSGKLKAFLAYAFGAPIPYTGKGLREAHRHMQLEEVHFNAVAEHLAGTLQQLHVDAALIDEVMTIAGSVRNEVLNQ